MNPDEMEMREKVKDKCTQKPTSSPWTERNGKARQGIDMARADEVTWASPVQSSHSSSASAAAAAAASS